MLKILKIMMRVISSGKLQMRRARHFPQKIQGHLLSCLWTANLKVPQSLSQWVSDQWWGHLLGCLWTAKKTKGVWVSEWQGHLLSCLWRAKNIGYLASRFILRYRLFIKMLNISRARVYDTTLWASLLGADGNEE